MPSIEILAINQAIPITDHFSFSLVADEARKSHRCPSRFQEEFSKHSRILYHLGNPDLREDSRGRIFFAYELLSPASRKVDNSFLEFAPAHLASARRLLDLLIDTSPTRQLLFTSDWQFGPDWTRFEPALSFEEFWNLHDQQQLQINALYPIRGS